VTDFRRRPKQQLASRSVKERFVERQRLRCSADHFGHQLFNNSGRRLNSFYFSDALSGIQAHRPNRASGLLERFGTRKSVHVPAVCLSDYVTLMVKRGGYTRAQDAVGRVLPIPAENFGDDGV
jgi:hypothetical protein